MLSLRRLKEVLNYDPATGHFTWKIRMGQRGAPGARAGYLTNRGYIAIGIDGQVYSAARLACFYMTGKWPNKVVDHKDRDRRNDRWDNLRKDATQAQNCANASTRCDNVLGVKGVDKKRGKYRAQIQCAGKKQHIGYYDTLDAAAAAYKKAAQEKFGDFAYAQ